MYATLYLHRCDHDNYQQQNTVTASRSALRTKNSTISSAAICSRVKRVQVSDIAAVRFKTQFFY